MGGAAGEEAREEQVGYGVDGELNVGESERGQHPACGEGFSGAQWAPPTCTSELEESLSPFLLFCFLTQGWS